MLKSILIAPSLNSLFITGILIFIIVVMFFVYFREFKRLDYFQKLSLLALISISVGVHGMIHLGVENTYGYNPYNWI